MRAPTNMKHISTANSMMCASGCERDDDRVSESVLFRARHQERERERGTHEVRDVGLALADDVADELLHGADAGDDVGVRDLDALGRAGRAARVHEARNVLRSGQVRLARVRLAKRDKLVKGVDLERVVAVLGARRLERVERALRDVLGAAVVDDDAQRRRVGDDAGERVEEVGVGEDAVRVGLVDRVLQALLAERVVRRRERDALLRAG